ncbi:MAG: flavodoxin family protein [Chloroflexi bacterium]|nr:flavodoxin family protein [Chloroflexota bacterium]
MADRSLEVLIVYVTERGRTGAMVEPIRAAIEAEGVGTRVRTVEEVTWEEMKAADGIIVGNPARFGGMDWQLKRLFDVVAHQGYPGPLVGKVGGAFTAGSRPGSGAELALMSTLHVLLNHGMIVQGNAFSGHYGPIALRESSIEEVEERCRQWGVLWARLVRRLAVAAQELPR